MHLVEPERKANKPKEGGFSNISLIKVGLWYPYMFENRTLLELKNKFLCKAVERNVYVNGSASKERGREGCSLDQTCEGVETNSDFRKNKPSGKINYLLL